MPTVREAALDVLRLHDLTTVFANPGSTEVPFLAGLPDDIRFVLALHEGSVVGAATGWALARDAPALALLHTTAGLGNAVGALSTARVNRAPLVVIVGQQDRRHLVQEPFLAGRLEQLAGDYPVRTETPPRAQDVPGAIARAAHAARTLRGPALVIVPMDDWAQPAEDLPLPAPAELRLPAAADAASVREVAGLLDACRCSGAGGRGGRGPSRDVGGADAPRGAARLRRLAGVLRRPCRLPPGPSVLRRASAGRPYAPAGDALARTTWCSASVLPSSVSTRTRRGRWCAAAPGSRWSPTIRPRRTGRRWTSPSWPDCRSSVRALAEAVDERGEPTRERRSPRRAAGPPDRRGRESRCVRRTCWRRSPSACPRRRWWWRRPPPAVPTCTPSYRPGVRWGSSARRWEPWGSRCRRPSAYGWGRRSGRWSPSSATDRRCTRSRRCGPPCTTGWGCCSSFSRTGATRSWTGSRTSTGAPAPWPAFDEVSVAGMAEAMGCPACRVSGHGELLAELDGLLPALAGREEPLVLEVAVQADETFLP